MQTRLERGVGVLGVLAAVLTVSGAGQRAPEAQPPEESRVVFRATAELVQFDAVVLDVSRRPVSTLTLDDFEVRQDGALVELLDVAFIDRASRHATRGNGGAELTVAPRVGIDVEPLIFLIDDMVMSPGGFDRVRTALRQFVDEGIPPGLEIGLLRTGETGRRTTALTADAGELRGRVDAMRYMARSVRGGPERSGADSPGYRDLERTFVDGALGSLNSLLVSLRALPGRKTVVVFSEGIALRTGRRPASSASEAPSLSKRDHRGLAALAKPLTRCPCRSPAVPNYSSEVPVRLAKYPRVTPLLT